MESGTSSSSSLNPSLPKNKKTKAHKSALPREPNDKHLTKLSKNGHRYKPCQICAQSPYPPETSPQFKTNRQLDMHKVKYHAEQHFLPYFFPNGKPDSELEAQFKNNCDRFLFAEIFKSFKDLKCLYCPLKISAYYSRQTLRVHLLTVHLGELVEKLKNQQNKIGEEKAERHVERKLNPAESLLPAELTCKHCGILFTQPSGLACHMLTHQPSTPQQTSLVKQAVNQCLDCGKTVQKRFLAKHQEKSCPKKLYYNIHKPTISSVDVPNTNKTSIFINIIPGQPLEKSFERIEPERNPKPEGLTCKHCGILFTEPSGLACHMLTHQPSTPQQTYLVKQVVNQCPDCGKAVKKKYLDQHQKKSCPKKLYYNINSNTTSSVAVSSTKITDKLIKKLPEHVNQTPVKKAVMKVNMHEIIDLVDEDCIKEEHEESYEMILPD